MRDLHSSLYAFSYRYRGMDAETDDRTCGGSIVHSSGAASMIGSHAALGYIGHGPACFSSWCMRNRAALPSAAAEMSAGAERKKKMNFELIDNGFQIIILGLSTIAALFLALRYKSRVADPRLGICLFLYGERRIIFCIWSLWEKVPAGFLCS